MQSIAVIGAGIAGLTVALRRARAGDEVTLFEAGSAVGGQLRSEPRDGFLIEHGAEGFVARSQAVPALAADAGLAERIVEQLEQRSFRFDGARLVELAPGEAGRLLGFQVPADELGRGIRSFTRGMGELPEALAGVLRDIVRVRLDSRVHAVTPLANAVRVESSDGAYQDFSAVVIATPARAAASLLRDSLGATAWALLDSAVLSSLTVSLGYRRSAVAHPLDGTGFIVPAPDGLEGLRAVTFSSSKLPGRAPAEHALLRLFFRPSARERQELSDDAWVERAARALGRAVPVTSPPVLAAVSHWPDALPVFDDAHRARVSALSERLAGTRIALAGAAFHGSGIDAAIRSAEECARSIAP